MNSVIAHLCPCTTDETDYTPLVPEFIDVLLIFNNATRRQCFYVRITNDIQVEGSEEFSLLLLEDPFAPPPTQTVFNASLATLTVLDQDGKIHEFDQLIVAMLTVTVVYLLFHPEAVIGFLETNYSACESSECAHAL